LAVRKILSWDVVGWGIFLHPGEQHWHAVNPTFGEADICIQEPEVERPEAAAPTPNAEFMI
jgi:hypothetical protein